jgi:drug/metabolite transporter (DMT)-like permease
MNHRRGLFLAFAGIVALSPESLLIRLVTTDRWTLLVWRGTLMSIGLTVASVAIGRSFRVVTDIGRPGIAVAVLFALQTVGFVTSITHTTAANTLIAMSAAPLFAVLIERVAFGTRVSRRMLVVILCAMAGIAVMVSDSVGSGGLFGDAAGLAAAAAFGASFVVIRRNADRFMVPAMGLGGLVAALIALGAASPADVSASDVRYLAISGLVVLPLGFGLLSVAPRHLIAPEVALVTLLEAILGPLWVWWAVGETPGVRAALGGAVVLGSLAINSYLGLRTARAGVS